MITIYLLIRQIVNLFLIIVTFFLGLRILFLLFSINPQTPFVAWIISISNLMVSPFAGILPNLNLGIGVLDLTAVLALILYDLLASFVLIILRGVTPDVRHHAQTHYHDIEDDHTHKH